MITDLFNYIKGISMHTNLVLYVNLTEMTHNPWEWQFVLPIRIYCEQFFHDALHNNTIKRTYTEGLNQHYKYLLF